MAILLAVIDAGPGEPGASPRRMTGDRERLMWRR